MAWCRDTRVGGEQRVEEMEVHVMSLQGTGQGPDGMESQPGKWRLLFDIELLRA
jgi:hypothetical protein